MPLALFFNNAYMSPDTSGFGETTIKDIMEFTVTNFFDKTTLSPPKIMDLNALVPEPESLKARARVGASLLDHLWKHNTNANADALACARMEPYFTIKNMKTEGMTQTRLAEFNEEFFSKLAIVGLVIAAQFKVLVPVQNEQV